MTDKNRTFTTVQAKGLGKCYIQDDRMEFRIDGRVFYQPLHVHRHWEGQAVQFMKNCASLMAGIRQRQYQLRHQPQ